MQPLPSIYYNSKFYFLYPELSQQFLFDTVIAGVLYVVGFIGLLSIYQSSKHAYNPRQAYMTMIIGQHFNHSIHIPKYFIRLKLSGA